MSTPGELKKLLEKRIDQVKDDLKRNSEHYDIPNIAIRKYEIIQLNNRILNLN